MDHIHSKTPTLEYSYITDGIYIGTNQCCVMGLADVLKKNKSLLIFLWKKISLMCRLVSICMFGYQSLIKWPQHRTSFLLVRNQSKNLYLKTERFMCIAKMATVVLPHLYRLI